MSRSKTIGGFFSFVSNKLDCVNIHRVPNIDFGNILPIWNLPGILLSIFSPIEFRLIMKSITLDTSEYKFNCINEFSRPNNHLLQFNPIPFRMRNCIIKRVSPLTTHRICPSKSGLRRFII